MSAAARPGAAPRLWLRWGTALLLIAVLLWHLAPPSREWVEAWYSSRLYPVLCWLIVPPVAAVGFSVSLVATATSLILAPLLLASGWLRARKGGLGRRGALARLVEEVLAAGLLAYVLFVLLWGAGYRRVRLAEQLHLPPPPAPSADRAGDRGGEAEAAAVARWTEGLRLSIVETLPAPTDRDPARAVASLASSLEGLGREAFGTTVVLPRVVKSTPPGLFLRFGSAGMTFPFFLEPHVDGGETDAGFVSVAAHELAHVAGWCGESDADLLGALAGLRAEDRFARYACALALHSRFIAHLSAEDRRVALEQLPEGAREDLREIEEARSRYYRDLLAGLRGRFYDAYLRSQGVKDGSREYAQVVSMLLRAERAGHVHAPWVKEPSASPAASSPGKE